MATQMATKMIQDWKNKNIGNRRGKRRSDMVYDGYDHNYSLTVKQSKKGKFRVSISINLN